MILGSATAMEPLQPTTPDKGGHRGADLAYGLSRLAAGHPAVFLDEANDCGYLAQAAELASVDFVALAMQYGTGALRVVALAERLDALGISTFGAAEHRVPVDLQGGVALGIRAQRAATLRAFANRSTAVGDLTAPGHVFPAAAGECLTLDSPCAKRATIEALALAGLEPVAGFAELVDHWGQPADLRACMFLARRLGLATISIREVIVQRELASPAAERAVEATIPTPHARFTAIGYQGRRTGLEYVAFVAGLTDATVRVHLHRRCVLGGVFGTQTCDCGKRLTDALEEAHRTGQGVIVYRAGEDSCLLEGCSTGSEADWAVTAELASILHDLGARRISLSSNEQIELRDLRELGIEAGEDHGAAAADTVPRLGTASAGSRASSSVAAPNTNASV